MSFNINDPVLVVDDDFTSCRIVEHYLKTGGMEVDVFENAMDALYALEQKKYSIILSDWFMPGMNGDAFMKQAKTISPDVPVIFLTANSDIENAVAMLRSGADDYLVKPVTQHDLLFRVGRTMEQNETRRILMQINREKEILELENKQLVNWRLMYATKESEQVRQIISLLARTINQSGGFMWLDLIEATSQKSSEGVSIAQEVFDLMLTAATQQRTIIELLTFINTIHTRDITLKDFPLGELTAQVLQPGLDAVKYIVERAGKEIKLYPAGMDSLHGQVSLDMELMPHIIRELVINAVKYSPPGARILIECFPEERHSGKVLGIRFRNPVPIKRGTTKGPVGIPYELSEQVFDLFYTLNHYPEELEGEEWIAGTGLYLVRQILQRMNAWIEVKNGLDYVTSPPEPFVQFVVLFPVKKE